MRPSSLSRLGLIAPMVAMSGLLLTTGNAAAWGTAGVGAGVGGGGGPKVSITSAIASAVSGITPSIGGDIPLSSTVQVKGGSTSATLNIASTLTAVSSANILAGSYQDAALRVCNKFTLDFKDKAQHANYDLSLVTSYSNSPIAMPIPFVVNGREVYKFSCDLRNGGSTVALNTPPAPAPKPAPAPTTTPAPQPTPTPTPTPVGTTTTFTGVGFIQLNVNGKIVSIKAWPILEAQGRVMLHCGGRNKSGCDKVFEPALRTLFTMQITSKSPNQNSFVNEAFYQLPFSITDASQSYATIAKGICSNIASKMTSEVRGKVTAYGVKSFLVPIEFIGAYKGQCNVITGSI